MSVDTVSVEFLVGRLDVREFSRRQGDEVGRGAWEMEDVGSPMNLKAVWSAKSGATVVEALRRLTSVDMGESEAFTKSQGLKGNSSAMNMLLTATRFLGRRDDRLTDATSAVPRLLMAFGDDI